MQRVEALKCGDCGRFVSYDDCDEYTPFGSSGDTEPPDPVFMCGRCARQMEERYVEWGRVTSSWIPSKAERRAAKRLGMMRAGPKGAAWAQWFAPDKVPEGWEIWTEET